MKMVEFADMHMMVANPEKAREHVDTFLYLFCLLPSTIAPFAFWQLEKYDFFN